jgi:hypothetical protein
MNGESLSNNALTDTEKLGKYVTVFLEFVFEKEKDRMCASAILRNLPLPRSTGCQSKLIDELVPEYPPHYWHALKKLKTMGIIKLDKTRIKDSSGKAKHIRAYNSDPDSVRVLERMADGFYNLGTGREPEE